MTSARRSTVPGGVIEADLSLPGHPEIWVAGDLASVTNDGKPVPGIAPAAKQMGRRAGRNLLRRIAGRPTLPFRYRDQGSLATIGRSAAVAAIGRFSFAGAAAWCSGFAPTSTS